MKTGLWAKEVAEISILLVGNLFPLKLVETFLNFVWPKFLHLFVHINLKLTETFQIGVICIMCEK